MRILVACEESQAVTIELRKLGHEAFSCDLLPCSGGHPEWHIKGDVIEQLNKGWNMMIGFPPCIDLASSGARWFEEKIKDGRQQQSIAFFMLLINAPIDKIAIENPIGIMSTRYKKPNQIIQPWQFGHGETKATCLWLKNLPELKPTNIVEGREQRIWKMSPGINRSKLRSKTFPGIAKAMAEQFTTIRESRLNINNKKTKTMRTVFIGKEYFNKGKRYEVLAKTEVSILLKVTQKKQTGYQVIDEIDEYPEKKEHLLLLNPFFTVDFKMAEEEYKKRNQLKIPQ